MKTTDPYAKLTETGGADAFATDYRRESREDALYNEVLLNPPHERVYIGTYGQPVDLDDVPLVPDADSHDCDPEALAAIYLDSELGRYFYVLPGGDGA